MNKIILIITLLFSINLLGNEKLKVRLVGNNWCPQHCLANSGAPGSGYIVEIVQEALLATGNSYTLKFQPWLRAIRSVETGLMDGLLTPAISEVESLPRHKIALATQRFCFYSRKSSKLNITKLEDIHHKSISYVKGNNLGEDFTAFVNNKNNMVSIEELINGDDDFAPRIFAFLLLGRADTIATTEDFADYYLKQNLHIKNKITKGYCIKGEPLHVGLSQVDKQRSKKIGEQIDKGLKIIKENGTYDKILNKYF